MALELNKEFPSGVTADYWKVINLSVNFSSMCATVEVGLYVNAAARSAGKSPVEIFVYNFDPPATDGLGAASQDTAGENPQKAAYTLLKTLPEFTGAVDV